MEEIIKLLRENNQMLKSICSYLVSQGSTEDNRNLMINILADLFVDKINNQNRK